MEDMKVPRGFLLLHNMGKKKNMGTVIRSASAFNLQKVFLINKHDDVLVQDEEVKKSVEVDGVKHKRAIR